MDALSLQASTPDTTDGTKHYFPDVSSPIKALTDRLEVLAVQQHVPEEVGTVP